MSLVQLTVGLCRVIGENKYVYIYSDPEIPDFTNPGEIKLLIYANNEELVISFKDNFLDKISLIKESLFQNDITVFCWNIKGFFSFLRFFTKIDFETDVKIIDLKVVEAFYGISKVRPEGFKQAIERFKESGFGFKDIYFSVYLPLLSVVIPAIETVGVIDSEQRKIIYPCYDIAGQVNGRLLCFNGLKNCFLPHTISPKQKEVFRPRQNGQKFIYLDYKHMEVNMLQWLAKDSKLEKLFTYDKDIYQCLFKLITGIECDTSSKREMIKDVFLPVYYGEGAKSLADKLSLSVETAEKLITRIKNLFPESFEWIDRNFPKNGTCVDFFGRKRSFEEKIYRYRNFIIQAPASLICLEKLVLLYNRLKGIADICCHIHDGYIICCAEDKVKYVLSTAKEVLEEESNLCRGLKLKVSVKCGNKLSEMES